MSDMTSLQLGLLAHGGGITWAGPLACDDFGRSAAEGGVDDVTEGCFVEAMSGALEAVGFRTDAGFDGLDVRGTLWGGNLTIVNSLLATPHWPRVKGGILFVEDVNEHPYRVERNLLQLQQAGVLDAQKAIVLGAVSGWRKSPNDRGYSLGVDARARSRRDPNADPDRAAVRSRRDQGDACRSARRCSCWSTVARRSSPGADGRRGGALPQCRRATTPAAAWRARACCEQPTALAGATASSKPFAL